MIELKIKIPTRRLKAAARRMERWSKELADTRRQLRDVVYPEWRRHLDRQFRTSGAGRWAKLTGRYQRFRIATTGHDTPLVWDKNKNGQNMLWPSMTEPGHPNHLYIERQDVIVTGSTLDYALDMVTGGVDPFGDRFPGRDIGAITPAQVGQVVTRVDRSIRRRAR